MRKLHSEYHHSFGCSKCEFETCDAIRFLDHVKDTHNYNPKSTVQSVMEYIK